MQGREAQVDVPAADMNIRFPPLRQPIRPRDGERFVYLYFIKYRRK